VADTLDRDGDAVDVTSRTEVLEGDDIVVIPDEPEAHTSRRRRIALVIGAVAAVVAILVIAAIAAGGNNKSEPQVVAASPNPNLGRTAAPPKAGAPTTIKVKRSTHQTTPHVSATAPARVVVPPSIPNATAPPTAAPGLTEFPVSAIRWTAPSSVTIAHNASTTITVIAHNPANGTITLPHPLACAPTLRGDGMCTEMAQILAPGESATAHYKIDGGEVPPGNYTLVVEGVLKINVKVTA
jgi:hypothetical protein